MSPEPAWRKVCQAYVYRLAPTMIALVQEENLWAHRLPALSMVSSVMRAMVALSPVKARHDGVRWRKMGRGEEIVGGIPMDYFQSSDFTSRSSNLPLKGATSDAIKIWVDLPLVKRLYTRTNTSSHEDARTVSSSGAVARETELAPWLRLEAEEIVARICLNALSKPSKPELMVLQFLKQLVKALRLLLYRMVKRVRRLVSGHCEIARICGSTHSNGTAQTHTRFMTKAFWDEWSTSKKLGMVFAEYATDSDMNVEVTERRICDTKNIVDDPAIRENVKKCLSDVKGVNALIAHVKLLSSRTFSTEDPEHEAKLELLWQTLLPDVERQGGRYSKDWGCIGFQQADPASDFRGGGVLALDQLIYIAQNRTSVARRMISEPEDEMSRYPWACVGINLTMEAIRIVESRVVDVQLYGKGIEEAMRVFNDLYADMFEILHSRWVKASPENVLAFPGVLRETLAAINEEIAETGALVPPGTDA